MPEEKWEDLLDQFRELGGVVENICQKEGEFGRGIFPIDPLQSAKIMTPRNLMISSDNIDIYDSEIILINKACYTAKESTFLEAYYNNYSWGNKGNRDSANFLKFIVSLSESMKTQLLGCGFVDRNLLSYCESDDLLLKRFISERVVSFCNHNVLAPVWEFVNHSSFVPPLRITPYGVETPPLDPSSEEILFKYSGKNSPVGMWKKYGFACRCIVSYSIPFKINISSKPLCIDCTGQLGLGPKEKKNFSIVGDTLSIKSLPVGCLSVGLPFANFKSILCSVGLSADAVNKLFPKVRELNIKARRDLLANLQEPGLGLQAELHKALTYEIELIETSSAGESVNNKHVYGEFFT